MSVGTYQDITGFLQSATTPKAEHSDVTPRTFNYLGDGSFTVIPGGKSGVPLRAASIASQSSPVTPSSFDGPVPAAAFYDKAAMGLQKSSNAQSHPSVVLPISPWNATQSKHDPVRAESFLQKGILSESASSHNVDGGRPFHPTPFTDPRLVP
jgi:hypothetical protein